LSAIPILGLISFDPLEGERMARREHQQPSVLERQGKHGLEYYIRYRVRVLKTDGNGKPVIKRKEKWLSLGLCSKITKRQAERERDKIMAEVNGQIHTIQSQVLLRDFLEVFRREHYRGLKETSKRYYDQRIAAWILPILGNRKLCQLGPLEISEMLSAMESRGVARTTRIATRAILATMLEKARRWGYLKEPINPARDAEIGRSNEGGRTVWTPTIEEARAIIENADTDVALILEIIVWTGMRISEVLGLRCRNCDLSQAILYVRERRSRWDLDDPKSAAGQRPLPLGYLAERLAPMMASPDCFLFRQADGEPWTDQLLYRRIRAAMDRAGLYHTGNAWHAFRRLHSTLMRKEMSLFDLRAQMGHADVRTTQRYVDSPISDRADALASAQSKVIPFRKQA
jgi:integrase